ncbi:MAG: type II secretion system F family protein [Lachnospiraceae bacterium]|nr:type II secretion system F family protein [Lachnospiraceae bacterium]
MERIDYTRYQPTTRDITEYAITVLIKAVTIGYLFYDSMYMFVILIPFFVMDYRKLIENKKRERIRKLSEQFGTLMEALVTSLSAGYSLERAFVDARRDLLMQYDKDELIFAEVDEIINGLKINAPIEDLLKEFGVRSGVEDIENFANIVGAAKKSGGNLIKIIEKTVRSLLEKRALFQEIETMLTAKKYEAKIMLLTPYGMLFYLRLSNGDFLNVLYHNLPGIMLMTVFLAGIYLADFWASKIIDIPV